MLSIIIEHGIKSSPEDPLPAGMLTERIDALLPYWMELLNLSLVVEKMDRTKEPDRHRSI